MFLHMMHGPDIKTDINSTHPSNTMSFWGHICSQDILLGGRIKYRECTSPPTHLLTDSPVPGKEIRKPESSTEHIRGSAKGLLGFGATTKKKGKKKPTKMLFSV